jgi:signal peptidase II
MEARDRMLAGAVMSTRKKWQLFACLVLIVVGLDQATKLYIHTTFALHESYPVIADLFALTYVRNSGAAFGLLARQSQTFLRLFFPIVTFVALLGLLIYFVRVPSQYTLRLWGLCLIISGALGNGLDRLWLGQVIDFLDVHWYDLYHWPAFNVADSSICIGVGLLLLDTIRTARD